MITASSFTRESLLHYAGWMVENEVPYKEVLHKVDIPTETCAAHDVRKCHVLYLAASYSSQPSDYQKYSERAGFFFERCMKDLLSFETALLTRPLVILTVYGFVHSYFQSKGSGPGFPGHTYVFGSPKSFCRKKPALRPALPAGPGLVADWLPKPLFVNCTRSGKE